MKKKWKYFKEEEENVKGVSFVVMDMLDKARGICGFPIKITSGLRTEEENKTIGGSDKSSHLKGLAVDLRAPKEKFLREKMLWALGLVGFCRIGIYDRHFHVDIDKDKVQDTAWGGKSK